MKRIIIQFCLSLVMTLALTMKFSVLDYSNIDLCQQNEVLENIKQSLDSDILKVTLIFCALILLQVKIDRIDKNRVTIRKNKILYVTSSLIGFVWLSSKSFLIDNTLVNIYITKGQIVKSIIYYFGSVYLLILINKCLFMLADSGYGKFLRCDYKKNESILKYFLFFLVAWMPHLIMAYPASLISDVWGQLKMFYGLKTFTSHHPPFHTCLVGIATIFGKMIGNTNLGLFLFIIIQSVIFAIILSYAIFTMKELRSPKWLIYFTVLIAVTSPYYTAYIGLITKDTLYSYFFLLYMIELAHIFREGITILNEKIHIVLFILSSALVILLRNNGKYVIYPMVVILVFLMLKRQYFHKNRNLMLKGILVLALSIFIPVIINTTLEKTYNIEKGSIKEMLSLPFQQTARYVLYFESDVTENERDDIDCVLDYDSLKKNYNPMLSDAVKNTFHQDCTNNELAKYFKVWLKHFFRHPFTYIGATLNQNYKLIYPERIEYIYLDTYNSNNELHTSLGISENQNINKKNKDLENYYRIMFKIPGISIFSLIAFYNLILIYMLVHSFYKKIYSLWIIAVPLIISILVVIAGPLVHPRYLFPIIYSLPIVLSFYLYVMGKKLNYVDDNI